MNKEQVFQYAENLLDAHKDAQEIEQSLRQKGISEEEVGEIMRYIRKKEHAIMGKKGLTKVIIGGALLAGGFLISCINFHANQSFNVIMYSSTSLGLFIVLWGLYQIIG